MKSHIYENKEPLHNIIRTESIKYVSNIIKNYVTVEEKRILLVCDADDTLVHSPANIGSDSWFYYALKTDNIRNVRKKLGLIYALLDFNGIEKETNDFVNKVKELSDSTKYPNFLKYICLTARNVEFHPYTIKHFNDSGYADVFVRPNMLNINDPLYIKDVNDTDIDRYARYIDNICSCSGSDKGSILVNILSQYYDKVGLNDRFNVIIFVDDSLSNIHKVHTKLSNYLMDGESSLCIHYTYKEEYKNSYSIYDFTNDSKKIDELLEFKRRLNLNNFNRE